MAQNLPMYAGSAGALAGSAMNVPVIMLESYGTRFEM
jgi:hypothetical protein